MSDRLGVAALAAETTIGFGLRSHALTGPETVMLALADPGPDCQMTLVAPDVSALANSLWRQGRYHVTVIATLLCAELSALQNLKCA